MWMATISPRLLYYQLRTQPTKLQPRFGQLVSRSPHTITGKKTHRHKHTRIIRKSCMLLSARERVVLVCADWFCMPDTHPHTVQTYGNHSKHNSAVTEPNTFKRMCGLILSEWCESCGTYEMYTWFWSLIASFDSCMSRSRTDQLY